MGKAKPNHSSGRNRRSPKSEIEWTDATWNPVTGCTKIGPGCDHCNEQKVPFFFKQWGGARPKSGGRLLDDREWNEFPTHVVPAKIREQISALGNAA